MKLEILKVKFTKNFGRYKKGDEAYFDKNLAIRIVKISKVAKFVDKKDKK